MSFKPFKWIKNHPLEAAAIGAGLVLTGGAAGLGPAAGLFAGEAAAGAGAGALALETGGPAMLGADAFAGASLGAEAAGGSALLGALPEGAAFGMNPFAMGDMSGMFANAGGAEASLFSPAQLSNPATAMGPRESTWLSRQDPKKLLQLGQMAAQAGGGGGGQQGGPQPMPEPPSMRSALRSQEDITKQWLLHNDPNTYRRIYGNPQQGVA